MRHLENITLASKCLTANSDVDIAVMLKGEHGNRLVDGPSRPDRTAGGREKLNERGGRHRR